MASNSDFQGSDLLVANTRVDVTLTAHVQDTAWPDTTVSISWCLTDSETHTRDVSSTNTWLFVCRCLTANTDRSTPIPWPHDFDLWPSRRLCFSKHVYDMATVYKYWEGGPAHGPELVVHSARNESSDVISGNNSHCVYDKAVVNDAEDTVITQTSRKQRGALGFQTSSEIQC